EMYCCYTGVICPGRETAQDHSQRNTEKNQDRNQHRTRPPSTQVSELRHRLGKDDLKSIPLKIAEDRGAEDGRHHDRSEEAKLKIDQGYCERAVQQQFAGTNGPKVARANGQEPNQGPEQEVTVGRQVLK